MLSIALEMVTVAIAKELPADEAVTAGSLAKIFYRVSEDVADWEFDEYTGEDQ